jgi:hypothetical protein
MPHNALATIAGGAISPPEAKTVDRDARLGQFAPEAKADANPDTHVKEIIPWRSGPAAFSLLAFDIDGRQRHPLDINACIYQLVRESPHERREVCLRGPSADRLRKYLPFYQRLHQSQLAKLWRLFA